MARFSECGLSASIDANFSLAQALTLVFSQVGSDTEVLEAAVAVVGEAVGGVRLQRLITVQGNFSRAWALGRRSSQSTGRLVRSNTSKTVSKA